MDGCRSPAPGSSGAPGGSPESAATGPRAVCGVLFPAARRLPAAHWWLARLLAAPLFLLQPAAAQAEIHAGESRADAAAARTIRAAGAADDPHADRARPAPRPMSLRRGGDPLPAALLPDDNVDDDAEDAPALPGPARDPMSASAPAGADAARPRWRGGGIRGPPGIRAPPAPRVLRAAAKESRGRDSARRLFSSRNDNNARPSPAATRPQRAGTG